MGDCFWDYTNANAGKYMAIVMGGNAREVAVIKKRHPRHRRNRGLLHRERSDYCSKLLRTGALPASLVFLENRTGGRIAGGPDSIRDGVTAAVIGVFVVMAFMLIYYKSSGINADLACS